MNEERIRRIEAIKQIIAADPELIKQENIKKALEDKGIYVTQSTISKDLKAIKAEKDKDTGKYILKDEIKISIASDKLINLFNQTKMEVIEEELIPLTIKVDEKYTLAVANELVSFSKEIDETLYAFPGLNGAIYLLISNKEEGGLLDFIRHNKKILI